MPRPQKYDWDDKRDICYKLRVEQKLSAPKIIQYFSDHLGVSPSELPNPSQFCARFRIWGFPSRAERLEPEDKERVVERTTELLNQNHTTDEALRILQSEGWTIDRWHYGKLRKEHGMLLRVCRPGKAEEARKKRKRAAGDDGENEEAVDEAEVGPSERPTSPDPPPLPPGEAARRAQRMMEMQIESDQKLHTRKRRRRIRGYAHMPADDPGVQPRYGSETSLDECKVLLHLDNESYQDLRGRYEDICRDMGVVKMTLCHDGQWQASKDRLIRESPHLSAVMHPLQPDLDKKIVALHCICCDVTKRMRINDNFMSVSEANNTLGLNFMQSKQVRRSLYDLLEADQFAGVLISGPERMEQLRNEWIAQWPSLQQAIAENDPRKLRALKILDKEARKRYASDQFRKDPSKKQWTRGSYGPGPGPAVGRPRKVRLNDTSMPPAPSAADTAAAGLAATNGANVAPADFDIDPLLAAAVRRGEWSESAPGMNAPGPTLNESRPSYSAVAPLPILDATVVHSTTAYFRLAPNSQLQHHPNHPKMWLGRLGSPTLASLHAAATSKAEGTRVAKVQGVARNPQGSEDAWLIDGEDELFVYLAEAGEKATFVVTLMENATS